MAVYLKAGPQLSPDDTTKWKCALCQRERKQIMERWHCLACNYDVCFDCSPEPAKPFVRPICLTGNHEMFETVNKLGDPVMDGLVEWPTGKAYTKGYVCRMCLTFYKEPKLDKKDDDKKDDKHPVAGKRWHCSKCVDDVCFNCFLPMNSQTTDSVPQKEPPPHIIVLAPPGKI